MYLDLQMFGLYQKKLFSTLNLSTLTLVAKNKTVWNWSEAARTRDRGKKKLMINTNSLRSRRCIIEFGVYICDRIINQLGRLVSLIGLGGGRKATWIM